MLTCEGEWNDAERNVHRHARGFNERERRSREGGCPADGPTDAAEDDRIVPSFKSASTPRGVSAPTGSAAFDRATRRRKSGRG